jgi:hypothetical protein
MLAARLASRHRSAIYQASRRKHFAIPFLLPNSPCWKLSVPVKRPSKPNAMGQGLALSVGVALLLVTYHAWNLLQWRYARSRRMKEFGCKEPPEYPHKDPVLFGLDLFLDGVKALQNQRFLRRNVANLPAFEVHFQKLLKLILTDGSTVDLKPLLYKLVSDLPL